MASRKALIIENDESYLRIISGVLAGLGFRNLLVREESSAPQLAKQELPDLIVLSVELPKVNGYVLCKRIKETEETKRIPLILISAKAGAEDFEKHRKLRIRADEYLLKPFNQENFRRKVEALIDLAPKEEMELREEAMIPPEQRVISGGEEVATIQEVFDKLKLKNKMVVEKLRRELKEKTDSEQRLSRILAAEREGFQREKIQSESKLNEIDQLKREKNQLKKNISELEVALQKGGQSGQIRNRLDQALTERDKLNLQYQKAMEENRSLIADLKRELEDKNSFIAKNEELQKELKALKKESTERKEEDKDSLAAKNEELQREIKALQEKLKQREEEVAQVSKELESELTRKAEELQAQLAPSQKKEEDLEEDLEKEIVQLKEEKEFLEKKSPEAKEGFYPEVTIASAQMQKGEKKFKRSPFQLGIIGGVGALLVIAFAGYFFFRNTPSPDHSSSSSTPKPIPVASAPPLMSEKGMEKAEAEAQEEKEEEKKEVKTPEQPLPPTPPKKPPVKVAKQEVPRYTVQVGVYQNKADLGKVTKSLKKMGLEPYTVTEQRKSKKKLYYVYLDKKFILGEANSVSMKLDIFEISNRIIKRKDGKYSILAGRFSTRKKANETKQKISEAGYSATLTPRSSTQPIYISQAGKFPTREEADRVANTLRKSGYKPEVVELKK
jgi:DNA-binding response OmpR family regulator